MSAASNSAVGTSRQGPRPRRRRPARSPAPQSDTIGIGLMSCRGSRMCPRPTEWGHAVGLGHILDPLQLMSPMPIVSDWGAGDLAGLRRLGRGPCLDVPTAEFDAALIPGT